MHLFSIKRLISTCLPALLMTGSVTSTSEAKPIDPFALYPNDIEFNIKRNGDPVGKHAVSFYRVEDDITRVIAQMSLQVRFLSIPVYSYFYRSEADWKNGNLVQLAAEQNDGGKNSIVRAFSQKDTLLIKGPYGTTKTKGPVFPTNHWNADVLSNTKVINTLNGKLSFVNITAIGEENIKANGKVIPATKYRYTGDIETTVWYTPSGHWVKMQFQAKDGSTIDYECVECGLTSPPLGQKSQS